MEGLHRARTLVAFWDVLYPFCATLLTVILVTLYAGMTGTYPRRSHSTGSGGGARGAGQSGGGGSGQRGGIGRRSIPVGSSSNPAATSSQLTGVYGSQFGGGGRRQPLTYLFVQTFPKVFYLQKWRTDYMTKRSSVIHDLWLEQANATVAQQANATVAQQANATVAQQANITSVQQANVTVSIPKDLETHLSAVWPCLDARPNEDQTAILRRAKDFWLLEYNKHAGNTVSFFDYASTVSNLQANYNASTILARAMRTFSRGQLYHLRYGNTRWLGVRASLLHQALTSQLGVSPVLCTIARQDGQSELHFLRDLMIAVDGQFNLVNSTRCRRNWFKGSLPDGNTIVYVDM